MKIDPVHMALQELSRRLTADGIEYAIIGGMALGAHGYVRVTQDIDILMTREGLQKFQEKLIEPGYLPVFSGASKHFKDTSYGVCIKIITSGKYPGDGKPKEVSFPEPSAVSIEIDGLRVIRLEKLIELKLASGLSAPHRIKDLADVQQLIEILDLPEAIADDLSTYVRDEYLRLWQVTQDAKSL
jgi:hypothetical protein